MPDEEHGDGGEHRTDPFVERLRPDPGQPPQSVLILEGLLGDSDRAGHRRLYFTRSLNYYAEFRDEDVVYTESIPADQGPMPGLDATRVGIRAGASIDHTRTVTAEPVDEFDLDVQLGSSTARAAGAAWSPYSCLGTCGCGPAAGPAYTWYTVTCNTCHTGCGCGPAEGAMHPPTNITCARTSCECGPAEGAMHPPTNITCARTSCECGPAAGAMQGPTAISCVRTGCCKTGIECTANC
jgi:hypothetical protein